MRFCRLSANENQGFTAVDAPVDETSSPGGRRRRRGLFLLDSGGSRSRAIGRAFRAGPIFLRSVFRGIPATAFQSKRSVRDKTLRRPFTDGTGAHFVPILDVFAPLFKNLMTFRAAVFVNWHCVLLETGDFRGGAFQLVRPAPEADLSRAGPVHYRRNILALWG